MTPTEAAAILRNKAGLRSRLQGSEALTMGAEALERIAALERELAEAKRDAARLTALEELASENHGGLLIHHQIDGVEWTGVGLGLSHRTLRAAIDTATKGPNATE